MKKLNFLCICTVSVALLFSACSKNTSSGGGQSSQPNVYIAGSNGGAMYWENGQTTTLGSGNPAGIVVSGNDIYVAGTCYDGHYNTYAIYWKNGQADTVWDNGEATAIAVSGSDVYVVGYLDTITATGVRAHTVYWKNRQLVTLSNSGRAESIVISGKDVYISGELVDTSTFNTSAVYWKNGQLVTLQQTNAMSWGYSIAVSGNDVYVGGETEDNLNAISSAIYWKNGQPVILSSDDGIVRGIGISGNNVYAAGNSYGTAICWKNGQADTLNSNTLLESSNVDYAMGMTIYNNDVYIVGQIANGEDTYGDFAYWNIVYWKNGQQTIAIPNWYYASQGLLPWSIAVQ
jgi:predicted small secreted protein